VKNRYSAMHNVDLTYFQLTSGRTTQSCDALDAASSLAELNQPGFDFHPLGGKPKRYSIHVNGSWCITFEWSEGKAYRVDLEQYH